MNALRQILFQGYIILFFLKNVCDFRLPLILSWVDVGFVYQKVNPKNLYKKPHPFLLKRKVFDRCLIRPFCTHILIQNRQVI